MFRFDYWICRAIAVSGSQKELARRMGEKPEKVSYLLNRAKKISMEDALKIESATNGVVTHYHLLGHIASKLNRELEEKCSPFKSLKLSERVAIGVSYGKKLGKHQGARTDLKPCQNFSKLKRHRSEKSEVDYVGFNNRETYRQAKRVIECGSWELIDAMDSGHIAISAAVKLIDLPQSEQLKILQLSKKEIIAQIKRSKQVNSYPRPLTQDDLDTFLLSALNIYVSLSSCIKE